MHCSQWSGTDVDVHRLCIWGCPEPEALPDMPLPGTCGGYALYMLATCMPGCPELEAPAGISGRSCRVGLAATNRCASCSTAAHQGPHRLRCYLVPGVRVGTAWNCVPLGSGDVGQCRWQLNSHRQRRWRLPSDSWDRLRVVVHAQLMNAIVRPPEGGQSWLVSSPAAGMICGCVSTCCWGT